LVDVLTGFILVADGVLSVWNSYTAGFTYENLKKNGGPSWMYISAILGLVLGLAGAVYVTTIVLSLLAYMFGLVDISAVDLLLTYNFLITAGLITALGIGVTVQSIYVATKRPGVWTVANALYNTFASVWNVFVYMKNFGPAMSIINYERRNDRKPNLGTLIILVVVVILLSVFLSYIAFNAGRNRVYKAPVRIARRSI
jgi:hypothetical protein